jgi:sterol desaturase/sphingolipid hydroxylase (fatty acid hydroxylase superfamily)
MIDSILSYAGTLVAELLLPTGRFFFGYLAFAAMFAIGLFYWRTRSLRGAIAAVFRPDVFLHPSAIADYKVAAVNGVLNFAVLGLAGLTTLAWTNVVRGALATTMGSAAQPWSAGVMSGVIYAVALFLTYDAGNFVQHYLQHRIPLLWEFHKVHHSAEVLTPVTALRVHPIAELFTSQLLSLLFGVTNGVFLYLFAGKVAAMTVAGANILFFLHYTVGAYHLQHSLCGLHSRRSSVRFSSAPRCI